MTNHKAEMPELKPCPFCGGEADLCEHEGRTMSKHYIISIVCCSCDNVGQEAWGSTRQEATDNVLSVWNTRTDTESLRIVKEALETIASVKIITGGGNIVDKAVEAEDMRQTAIAALAIVERMGVG